MPDPDPAAEPSQALKADTANAATPAVTAAPATAPVRPPTPPAAAANKLVPPLLRGGANRTSAFCCWVRIVDWTRVLSVAGVRLASQGVSAKSKPRPKATLVDDKDPRAGGAGSGGGGMGRDEYAAFHALPGLAGHPGSDLSFDYGPSFSDYDDAMTWLASSDGVTWSGQAETYALFALANVDGWPLPRPAPTCTVPSYRPPGAFPPDEWRPDACDLACQSPDPDHVLLDVGAFDTWLDAFYQDKVLAKPKDNECPVLLGRELSERNIRRDEIVRKAEGDDWIAHALFKAVGIDYYTTPNATARSIVLMVLDATTPSVYRAKTRYNRDRPWNVCQAAGLTAMFNDLAHPFYPGHPSFPSGHATTAHLFAELLGNRYETTKPGTLSALHAIAAQIADDREVAGLHFETDSVAGEMLGKAMALRIVDVGGAPAGSVMQTNRQTLVDLLKSLP